MPKNIKGTYISEMWSTVFYHVPLQNWSPDNRIATFRKMLGKKKTQQNKPNKPQTTKLQLF